ASARRWLTEPARKPAAKITATATRRPRVRPTFVISECPPGAAPSTHAREAEATSGGLRLRGAPSRGRRRLAPAAEEPEEPALLGAADERLRVLVEARVVHQLAERALPTLELVRHRREAGDGPIEIAEHPTRIRLVLDQPDERAVAAVQTSGELVD